MTTIRDALARRWRGLAGGVALGLVVLMALPFVVYALGFGWRGLTRDLSGETYLYTAGGGAANVAVFGHMLAGAVITALAPVQLLGAVRRRRPALHRATGYLVAVAALASGAGGLVYIALRGTIGGPLMDAGFAIYGCLVVAAALETARHARARRFGRHRDWALRLVVLAMASWLYRLHYWVWYALTGGAASNDAFTGAFDRVQVVAFYLPYLIGVELYLRLRRPPAPVPAQ